MELGLQIKLARLSRKPRLRQFELAQQIEISQQTLYLIESGRRQPSKQILKALSKHLNLNLSKKNEIKKS